MTEPEDWVDIVVKPRSSRAGVELLGDGGIVVRVHAPAAEGAANRECVAALAGALGVAKSAVTIARGARSRNKRVTVTAMTAAEVRRRLQRARDQA